MIKEKSFMEELAEIVSDHERFMANDLLALTPDVSDGSSYDGFINFTDGFVDVKAAYTPKQYYSGDLHFNGGKNPKQKKRAANAQKIHDSLCQHNFRDFFDYGMDDEFKAEFETAEDFETWFNEYQPHQKDPTLSLFSGKPDFYLDPKHDSLYEEFLEYDDREYEDTPAFLGVRLMLYDKDNWRGGHKRMARLDSYFNDDLSYGRESVGSWARLMGMVSADGSDIGNHYIYTSEFQYTTLNDLKKKLAPRVQKAYESLGM